MLALLFVAAALLRSCLQKVNKPVQWVQLNCLRADVPPRLVTVTLNKCTRSRTLSCLLLFEHLNGQRVIAGLSHNNKTITPQQQQDVGSDVCPR